MKDKGNMQILAVISILPFHKVFIISGLAADSVLIAVFYIGWGVCKQERKKEKEIIKQIGQNINIRKYNIYRCSLYYSYNFFNI